MKNKIIISIICLIPMGIIAQDKKAPTEVCAYYFDYDASGHRVKRYYKCNDVVVDDPAPSDPKEPISTVHLRQGSTGQGNETPSMVQNQSIDLEPSRTPSLKEQSSVATPIIFPNPTTGAVTVLWDGLENPANLTLIDASGKILLQQDFGTGLLDLSNYPAGRYFVLLQSGVVSHQLPLIKK